MLRRQWPSWRRQHPQGPPGRRRARPASRHAAAGSESCARLQVAAALRWALAAAVLGSACCDQHVLEVRPIGAKVCADAVAQDNAQLTNLSITRLSSYYRASFDVTLPRAVERISKASAKLVQCPTNKACKHFYTMRFTTNVCGLVADRHTFWSPMFSGAQPPFHCPLEKRTYHFHNATVEVARFMDLFGAISSTINREAIWLARLDAFDEQAKQFACINIKMAFV